MKMGSVYILSRAGQENLCKIGFTGVGAGTRASDYTDGRWTVHKEFEMPLWLARVTEEAAHEELAEYWLDPDITGGTATEIFQIAADKAEIFVGTAIEKQRGIAIQSLGYDQQLLDAVRADRVEDLVEDCEAKQAQSLETIKELEAKIASLRSTLASSGQINDRLKEDLEKSKGNWIDVTMKFLIPFLFLGLPVAQAAREATTVNLAPFFFLVALLVSIRIWFVGIRDTSDLFW